MSDIKFIGVEKTYGRSKDLKRILCDVDITLTRGECILLTGKNGCGKSTLLRILSGMLKPDEATVATGIQSSSWKKSRKLLRNKVMYLYQEPFMFDGSVHRNLSYAISGSDTKQKINQALEWADLKHRENTEAKCLSGGEKQRVALAQAWLKQPDVLLLDEPTANMDDTSRKATEALLKQFKESNTALLIASHDINHFSEIMDKRFALVDGGLIDVSDDIEITHDSLSSSNAQVRNVQNYVDNVTPFPQNIQKSKED